MQYTVVLLVLLLGVGANGQELWMPFLRSHLGDLLAAFRPIENLNLGALTNGAGATEIPEDPDHGRYSPVGGYGKPAEVDTHPEPEEEITMPSLPPRETTTTTTVEATTTTTTVVPSTTLTTTALPTTTTSVSVYPSEQPGKAGPVEPVLVPRPVPTNEALRPGPVIFTTTALLATTKQTVISETTTEQPQRPGPVVLPVLPSRRPSVETTTVPPLTVTTTTHLPMNTRPHRTVQPPIPSQIPVQKPSTMNPVRPGPLVPQSTASTTTRRRTVPPLTPSVINPVKPGPVVLRPRPTLVWTKKSPGPVEPTIPVITKKPIPTPGPRPTRRTQRPVSTTSRQTSASPSTRVPEVRPSVPYLPPRRAGPVITDVQQPLAFPSNTGFFPSSIRQKPASKFTRENTVHLSAEKSKLPIITFGGRRPSSPPSSPSSSPSEPSSPSTSRPSLPSIQRARAPNPRRARTMATKDTEPKTYFPSHATMAKPSPIVTFRPPAERREKIIRKALPTRIEKPVIRQGNPSIAELCGPGQQECNLRMKSFETDYPIIRYALSHSTKLSGVPKEVYDKTVSIALPAPLTSKDSIAPEVAQLISNILQIAQPQKSLCVGAFTGVGVMTIAYASGVESQVIALEHPEYQKYWTLVGQAFVKNDGHHHARVDYRAQRSIIDNLEKLQSNEIGTFDFVLLDDVHQENYHREYEMSLALLKKGGFMMITNAYANGDAMLVGQGVTPRSTEPTELPAKVVHTLTQAIAKDTRVKATFLPFAGGTMLVVKQ